jgi:hypothetical protein
MTDPKHARLQQLLRTGIWWDVEQLTADAARFCLLHAAQTRRLPLSQWEALRRVGEQAAGYTAFIAELNLFFDGTGEMSGPGQHTRRQLGVLERDRAQSGWNQPALAQDLRQAITDTAELQTGARATAFKNELDSLHAEEQDQLHDWRRRRQAAVFLDALIALLKLRQSEEHKPK